MANSTQGKTVAVLPQPHLLFTESARKFKALHQALKHTVNPRDFIEELYVQEMAKNVWETQRLTRCKTALINSKWSSAIETLLSHLGLNYEEKSNLSYDFFGDENAKAKVLAHLAYFGLDESAIEAEAIKEVWTDLEAIDRRLTQLASRLDRLLTSAREYDAALAEKLRASSEDMIEDDSATVPLLVAQSKKRLA